MLCTLVYYCICDVTCVMVRSAWTFAPTFLRVVLILAVTFCCPLCVHSCALRSRPQLTSSQHCVFDSFVGHIVSSRTFLPINPSVVAGDSQDVTSKPKSLTCATLVPFKGRLVSVSWRAFLTAKESNSHARPLCEFEALATATLRDFPACRTLPELFLILSF